MDFIFPSVAGFTIYTKSNCRYCSLIKELLKDETREEIIYVNCDEYLRINVESFLNFIRDMAGVSYRTFPMVFYSGQFIGGYTETKKWWDQQQAFLKFDSESD
jgi:glutaredoxin